MKKIISLIFAAMVTTTFVFAQKPIIIPLWSNGAPNSNGLTGTEEDLNGGRVANVVNPAITVFPAKKCNGMAIIACPGGGYVRLAMNHEGLDMADWFNGQGITYVVLKYRMPNGHHDVPLSDAQQAIKLVRQHAAEWGVDPHKIGIMGSSAGGHLASTAATHFTEENRPDFQILFYPVINMDQPFMHRGSMENLLGKNPSKELMKLYSNEQQVKPNTPPAFIMCSADDTTVPCENSIRYFQALIAAKISATMHIYPIGGHGWGYHDNFPYKRQWTGELEKWLRELYR